MMLTSFTIFVIYLVNVKQFVESQTDCGRISLMYLQAGSTVEAKLRFSPSVQLSKYTWVHFFSKTRPNFDFLKDGHYNISKYNLKDSELIIKDLQASDNGFYNIECILDNEYQIFSENMVEIKEPYTVQTSTKTSVISKDETENISKQTLETTAYVITETTEAVRGKTNETLNNTKTTPEHDVFTTSELSFSRPDQTTLTSKEPDVITNVTPNNTATASEHDVYTTSEDPFSRSDQTALTSEETENTTAVTPNKTANVPEHDIYTDSEAPSVTVTLTRNESETATYGTITTILVGCGVAVAVVIIITIIMVMKVLRKKTCTPKTNEEDNTQHNALYLTNVVDKSERDASYCECYQVEDDRLASEIKLHTFSSSEPHDVPVNDTTQNTQNTREVADETVDEYTVIEYESESAIGYDSTKKYCNDERSNYVNVEMTGEPGNEYETIKV